MECVSFRLFCRDASIASTSLARLLVHVLIGVVANLRPKEAIVSNTISRTDSEPIVPCREISCLIIMVDGSCSEITQRSRFMILDTSKKCSDVCKPSKHAPIRARNIEAPRA